MAKHSIISFIKFCNCLTFRHLLLQIDTTGPARVRVGPAMADSDQEVRSGHWKRFVYLLAHIVNIMYHWIAFRYGIE